MSFDMSIPVGHWVEDEYEAQKWLQYFTNAAQYTSLGIDTETTGLSIINDVVVVWSLSDGEERICLPVKLLGMFREAILENPSVEFDGTNIKFDAHMLANSGIDISKAGAWRDTSVQSWLLNENNLGRHGLKECVVDHFNRATPSFEKTFGKVPIRRVDKKTGKLLSKTVGDLIKEAFLDPVKRIEASDYASLDAYNSKHLRMFFDTKLAEIPTGMGTLKDLYHNIEAPFTKVLWKMERRGITTDGGYLRALQGPMEMEMSSITKEFSHEATKMSGAPVMLNLDSVNDVRTFFYTLLNKPQKHMTDGGQTGNKQPSTAYEVLEEWAGEGDEWARKLMRYRSITKTHGTYVVGLQKWLDGYSKIHTTFKQLGAVTGRLSSAEPNLQNIPSPDRDEYKIRDGFIPGQNLRLIVADYEQLEMRLTAIFTNDKKMIDAINSGIDVHCLTVSEMQKIPYEEVDAAKKAKDTKQKLTPRQKELVSKRSQFKAVGFGILYGKGGKSLAEEQTRDTGVFMSEDEGKGAIRQWLSVFPDVRDNIELTKKHVWSFGSVQTITGRFRRFGDLKNMSKRDRAEAERQAFNSKIQGCKAEHSLVQTSIGLVTMRDVQKAQARGQLIPLLTYSGVESNYVVHNTGKQEVFAVETAYGTELVTKEHRFFSYKDEDLKAVQLRDLAVGDFVVACPSVSTGGFLPKENPTEAEAELIGVLCGDGSYTRGRDFIICYGNDHDFGHALQELLCSIFGNDLHCPIRKSKGSIGDSWKIDVSTKAPRQRLFDLGLTYVSMENKTIPEWVFTSPFGHRVACLRGLYDTDGGLVGGRYPSFTNISENLANGFARLAQSVGFPCRVTKHQGYKGGKTVFRVKIASELAYRFTEAISPRSVGKSVKGGLAVNGKLPPQLLKDVAGFITSSEAWKQTKKKTVELVNSNTGSWRSRKHTYTNKELFTHNEQVHVSVMKTGRGVSKNACLNYLTRLPVTSPRENLVDLTRHYWAEILSITPMGVCETLDLELLGNDHTYIGHGLLQHNSAADLAKCAMVKIDSDPELNSLGYRMLLQIHDEIVGECPDDDEIAEKVKARKKYLMDSAFGTDLQVKLSCSIGDGYSWATAKS